MQRPQAPAPNVFGKVMRLEPSRLGKVLAAAARSEAEGKYRHWDTLRHLKPPGDFSHQEWWGATKLVRAATLKEIPLRDAAGQPFRYALTDAVAQRLHRIDLGAGGLIGMPEPITNPKTRRQYVMRSLFQEALTSSQLEGAATTRAKAKEMIRTGRPPHTHGERMILNNYRTMQRIAEWKERPLDAALVFEMHRMVTDGTLDDPGAAGRLRREDEPVTVQDEITGEVYHHPPPAGELPARLSALCDFANEAFLGNERVPGRFVHPVVRAILLHFWLAYDHPFVDGNGRTARALFYWSMLRQRYWLFEFVSISEILLQAPAQYALSFLHTETDENDATYFLVHQTEVICRAIESLHQYVERKSEEWRSTEELLRDAATLNHRQQALIRHTLRHPGIRYTVEGHRSSHGTVHETARRDLMELKEKGWLEMRKIGKAFTFTASPDLPERVRHGKESPGVP